ncbi:MAG: DUF1667 domain-containing protein [Candidatus Bipolaricaulota bacterium]
MTTRRLTCILCPNGCEIDVCYEGVVSEDSLAVEGNLCPRGLAYALEELSRPQRTLTTSILVVGGTERLASVRTRRAIPRERLAAAREALRGLAVQAPIQAGEVVLEDVAGTGVEVFVTRGVGRACS